VQSGSFYRHFRSPIVSKNAKQKEEILTIHCPKGDTVIDVV